MKKLLSILLISFFTLILCLSECPAQGTKIDNNQNEILVFILRDSLEILQNTENLVTFQQVSIKSKGLERVLTKLKALGIGKAFPNWDENDSVAQTKEGIKIKKPEFNRVFKLVFSSEEDADSAIIKLRRLSSILYAEKDMKPMLFNDPHYLDGSQWHLTNDGRNGGTVGADVNALGGYFSDIDPQNGYADPLVGFISKNRW